MIPAVGAQVLSTGAALAPNHLYYIHSLKKINRKKKKAFLSHPNQDTSMKAHKYSASAMMDNHTGANNYHHISCKIVELTA